MWAIYLNKRPHFILVTCELGFIMLQFRRRGN